MADKSAKRIGQSLSLPIFTIDYEDAMNVIGHNNQQARFDSRKAIGYRHPFMSDHHARLEYVKSVLSYLAKEPCGFKRSDRDKIDIRTIVFMVAAP